MGKGGARHGAGRKPVQGPPVVVGMDGKAIGPVPPTLIMTPEQAAADPLAQPPEGLPAGQAAIWRAMAPLAIAQATLVAATVLGFREVVELLEMKGRAAGALALVDDVSLFRRYVTLSQRVDVGLARFRLTANGKAEPSAVKPKKASPWATAGVKQA